MVRVHPASPLVGLVRAGCVSMCSGMLYLPRQFPSWTLQSSGCATWGPKRQWFCAEHWPNIPGARTLLGAPGIATRSKDATNGALEGIHFLLTRGTVAFLQQVSGNCGNYSCQRKWVSLNKEKKQKWKDTKGLKDSKSHMIKLLRL